MDATDRNPIVIMDQAYMSRVLLRMAHQVLERNAANQEFAFFGINQRGQYVAELLATALSSLIDKPLSVYEIEVNYQSKEARFVDQDVPLLDHLNVLLVDDVIFSGTTMLAALNLLLSHGEPEQLMTAALIDRGHRKLPIHCDFYGLHYPTKLDEQVFARVGDDQDGDEAEVVLVHSPYDADSLKKN